VDLAAYSRIGSYAPALYLYLAVYLCPIFIQSVVLVI